MKSNLKSIYEIRLKTPLSGKDWVMFADAIEARFNELGYDGWGFNNQKIDRDLMAQKEDVTVVEGMIDGSVLVELYEKAVHDVLYRFGYQASSIELSKF